MKTLHRAALVRAYRTLAQGLGGAATATALTAIVAASTASQEGALRTALLVLAATIGAALVAAFTSFWMGVSTGLPEVVDASDE